MNARRGSVNRLLRFTKYEKLLALLFLLTLPLSNPWVRGDGVGYYAFARSMLIEHRLDFTKDWLAANTSFRMGRTDAQGNIAPEEYTSTGHLDNHFSIGPAILWSPFLVVAHVGVLAMRPSRRADSCRRIFQALHGGDGRWERPCMGFLALLISFALARRYVSGALGFSRDARYLVREFPAGVHVFQSLLVPRAFGVHGGAVSLVLGSHARQRTWLQWAILGAIGGLMMDVYYVNGVLLLLPLWNRLGLLGARIEAPGCRAVARLFSRECDFRRRARCGVPAHIDDQAESFMEAT